MWGINVNCVANVDISGVVVILLVSFLAVVG